MLDPVKTMWSTQTTLKHEQPTRRNRDHKGNKIKQTIKNALEIENNGGAVLAYSWTTGKGRFVSRRPVPEYCAEVEADQVKSLKGKTRQTAEKILRAHPRAKKLICVTDRRGLNREAAK